MKNLLMSLECPQYAAYRGHSKSPRGGSRDGPIAFRSEGGPNLSRGQRRRFAAAMAAALPMGCGASSHAEPHPPTQYEVSPDASIASTAEAASDAAGPATRNGEAGTPRRTIMGCDDTTEAAETCTVSDAEQELTLRDYPTSRVQLGEALGRCGWLFDACLDYDYVFDAHGCLVSAPAPLGDDFGGEDWGDCLLRTLASTRYPCLAERTLVFSTSCF